MQSVEDWLNNTEISNMALAVALTAGDQIVVVTDENSPTEKQSEISRNYELARGFRALIAAEQSDADALFSDLTAAFGELSGDTRLEVTQAAHKALRAFKKRKIDNYFRERFGQTYDEFVGSKYLLPTSVYEAEIEKARDVESNAEMIIFGFVKGDGGDVETVILASYFDWNLKTYSAFAGIGEGELAALHQLRSRGWWDAQERSLEETIFAAFEAKRTAEISEAVGSSTTIAVYSAKGPPQYVDERGAANLEMLLGNYGLRPWARDLNIGIPLRTQ